MRTAVAIAFAAILAILASGETALGRAPGLAVTLADTVLLATPEAGSEVVANIPGGSAVELTGESAPGYIEVTQDGNRGWVLADMLSVSGRPGIDTAVTTTETPLLVAPFPEADIVESIPEGEAVMLTGATVGGYDAASHDGAGGWIDRLDILRKFRP